MSKDQRQKQGNNKPSAQFTGNQPKPTMNNEQDNQRQQNNDGGGTAADTATQSNTGAVQSQQDHGGAAPAVQSSENHGEAAAGAPAGEQRDDVTSRRATEEEQDSRWSPPAELWARPAISQHAKGLLEDLHAYIERMGPTCPMTVAMGATNQRRLFRTLQGIINDLDGTDFELAFGTLLKLIETHAKGAFYDLNVYRFLDSAELTLTQAERRAFRDILNFLIKIAPEGSRHHVVKQVNLEVTFAGRSFSEDGRQRVQNFCHIR